MNARPFPESRPALWAETERELLRTADLVIVVSERLFQSKSPENPRTYLVRHGVDIDHFRRALDSDTSIPEEIAELPRPIIGYFGLISQDWIDLELLVKLAERFSHGSLVMLGKIAMDVSPLRALPNVHLLGRKPYESLPAYCKGFDVGIVPFPINEVTLNSNPLKAREYLAAGLPVISTAIPEVEVLGLCSTARDHEDFLRQTEQALQEPGPSLREERDGERSELEFQTCGSHRVYLPISASAGLNMIYNLHLLRLVAALAVVYYPRLVGRRPQSAFVYRKIRCRHILRGQRLHHCQHRLEEPPIVSLATADSHRSVLLVGDSFRLLYRVVLSSPVATNQAGFSASILLAVLHPT